MTRALKETRLYTKKKDFRATQNRNTQAHAFKALIESPWFENVVVEGRKVERRSQYQPSKEAGSMKKKEAMDLEERARARARARE